ncbi:MAG: DUF1127 domain-containing protein [Rhizobiaceae bacterium]|nr:MAG: DUF1127 domain-containing protein [Rhizobiaceae bacterium]
MPAHFLALPHAFRRSTVAQLSARFLAASALSRSRHSLARLDDHLLRDIGLTRSEAAAEASRAPWDAPSHWKG